MERVSQSAIAVASNRATASAASEMRSPSLSASSAAATRTAVRVRKVASAGPTARSASRSFGAIVSDEMRSARLSLPARNASYSRCAAGRITASAS